MEKESGKVGGRPGKRRCLFLIGMGMGRGRQLTLEAEEALSQCDVVMGAVRMLEDVGPWIKGKRVELVYLGRDVLEWLDAHPECKNAGVVYSGDTGFYSGCGSLMRELESGDRMGREKFQVRIFPGISSLSCLCARLGRPWEGIYPASVHGKTCDYVGLLKEHGRIFLLLSKGKDLGKICGRLVKEGMGNVKAAVGERLGYEDEKILTLEILCNKSTIKQYIPIRTVENSEPIYKMQQFVENNRFKDITLTMVAEYMGFSTAYCSKYIKKKTNLNFLDYVNSIHLREAEELLQTSDLSMTDVSYAAGFKSVQCFNRTFKKHRGMTPTEYRKALKNKK